ncbi:MAG: Mn2+/Fe2+ NRAMP family transporter [Planctomycetota bacterium]|jgi:Mn2+/Fe2+ NRAMP family transporter
MATTESEGARVPSRLTRILTIVGPGILIAATGVGAGDLALAAISGSRLGLAILWAVLLGAAIKFVLTEGLARYQLATGQTLLEGAMKRLGWTARVIFGAYLLLWSFFVANSLLSGCGIAMHAIFPVFDDASTGQVVFGVAHSFVALLLVRVGGFGLFEKIMGVCIGIMFAVVVTTAILLRPDPVELMQGLFKPSIPQWRESGLQWTVALMGGVGGTLTVLCYGYWIREKGREGVGYLTTCRIDLAVGYLMTAIFGVAMVVIGSHIEIEGNGAGLIVALADQLSEPLGSAGRWAFLIGAWGAIFSSLLGVWQAVPYVFADYLRLLSKDASKASQPVSESSRSYRGYLWALAVIPLIGLHMPFKEIQKVYAIFGAAFMPLLAIALLIMNGRRDWVGDLRNRWYTTLALLSTIIFFGVVGFYGLRNKFG